MIAGKNTAPAEPLVSVIVPTRNRAALLVKLLASLDVACENAGASTEVIVVDNGSQDDTASVIRAWCAEHATVRRALFEAKPGRSRALNRGVQQARGALIAFTDDDVEVSAGWLKELIAFFQAHAEYEAAVGPILLPAQIMADAELLERIRSLGTLPLFEMGAEVRDCHDLIGANNCVRRTALEHVGPFDESLGVGASGFGEDTDLALRLQANGARLGYAPRMIVTHHYDPERITARYHRDTCQRRTRSVFLMTPDRRVWRSSLRVCQYTFLCGWIRLFGSRARYDREAVALASHRERLRCRWRYWRTGRLAP